MNKNISKTVKYIKKNKRIIIRSILPVVSLCLVFVIIGIILPKPNDNISGSKNRYLFENNNPTFKVGFGDTWNTQSQYVRFESKPDTDNPFEQENSNIWNSIKTVFSKKQGFDMRLTQVRFSETDSDFAKNIGQEIVSMISDMEVDDIQTDTEVIEVGRLLGEVDDIPVSKETVLNRDVYPGIDIEYQILEGMGVKEEIIIRDMDEYSMSCASDSDCLIPLNEFVFDLTLDEGVQIKRSFNLIKGDTESTYYLTDKEDNYLAHFLPSFAIDGIDARTNDVDMIINHIEGDNYEIVLTLNSDWLFSSDRVFPIRIDPSVVHDTTTEFDTGSDYGTEVVTGPKVQPRFMANPYVIDSDTVGYWSLDQENGTGAYLLDESGSGYDGTPSGATYAGGIINGAREFDGDDSITTSLNSDADYLFADSTDAWSVEAWFTHNGTNASNNVIVGLGGGTGSGANFAIYVNTSQTITVLLRGGYTVLGPSSSEVDDGNWHHVAVTWDGTTAYAYFDGEKMSGSPTVGTASQQTSNFTIGATNNGGNSYYNYGSIDEVRVSNIARTEWEIEKVYRRGISSVHRSAEIDLAANYSIDSISWTEYGSATSDLETPYSTTGLVGQWDFNETSGTTADNEGSCGSSCDGTLYNMTTTSQDVVAGSGWTSDNRRAGAGALMFDGSNDYVKVGDHNDLDFGTGDFSISLWFKTQNYTDWQYFLDKGYDTGDSTRFGVGINGTGTPSVGLFFGTKYAFAPIEHTYDWTHMVAVRDGDDVYVYINGVLIKTNTGYSALSATNSDDLIIGQRSDEAGNLAYDGALDAVRIYSRALSESEILSDYGAGNIETRSRTSTDGSTWTDWTGTESNIYGSGRATGLSTSDISIPSNNWDFDTPVMSYTLDETNGDLAGYDVDDGGSGSRDGEFYGSNIATGVTDGVIGKARDFNGTDDHIYTNSSSFPTGDFTFSAWVNTDTLSTSESQAIMMFGTSGSMNNEFLIIISENTGTISVFTNNIERLETTLTVNANEWTNIIVKRDGSEISVYLNGVRDPIIGSDGTALSISCGMLIGTDSDGTSCNDSLGNWFDGTIDDIRIYDTAVTDAQAMELFYNGKYEVDTTAVTSNDISSNTMLPFWIASDEKGQNIELIYGEDDYSDNLSGSDTTSLWHMDTDPFEDDDGTSQLGVWDSIDYGVKDTNITLTMNQWNGSSNAGEIDITCSGGDSACYFTDKYGVTIPTTSINYGVAVDDAGSGTAYLMYSPSAVRTRFTVHGSNSDNYVAVRHDGTNWEYNGNTSTWTDFTPIEGDTIVAMLTLFSASTILDIVPSTSQDAVIGDSLYFSGDEYLVAPASNFNSGATGEDLTVSFWMNPQVSQNQYIVGHGGESAGVGFNWGIGLEPTDLWIRTNGGSCASGDIIGIDQWYHVAITWDVGTGYNIYLNGVLQNTCSSADTSSSAATNLFIGKALNGGSNYYNPFDGLLDEFRIDDTIRTADQIRQLYESGMRTHKVNVRFKADLQSGALISDTSDLSFSIDERDYGANDYIENIDVGETIIVKEQYGLTEYIAQGDIATVNTSTGAVTIDAWDSGSTVPSGGFTVNATVFKWQREYVDIRQPLDEDINGITNITFRKLTDLGANFWIDDIKKATYDSDYTGSSFTTVDEARYVQYDLIFTKWDSHNDLDLYVSQVDIDYSVNGPTMDQVMRHGKWFNGGEKQSFWWVGN